ETYEVKARNQRLEILAVLLLAGRRKRANGSAMKGVVDCDHLKLVLPELMRVRSGQLDSAFNRLCAAVAEKCAVHARDLRKRFRQRSLIGMVIKVRDVKQSGSLVADGFHDARMRVAQHVHAEARHEVEIFLPIDVPNPATLAA